MREFCPYFDIIKILETQNMDELDRYTENMNANSVKKNLREFCPYFEKLKILETQNTEELDQITLRI